MTLSLTDFLINLSFMVFIWTCISLSWGIVACVIYTKLIKRRELAGLTLYRRVDKANQSFIILASIVLVVYLLIEPYLQMYVGESFIAINVFYCGYLATISKRLYRWWVSDHVNVKWFS